MTCKPKYVIALWDSFHQIQQYPFQIVGVDHTIYIKVIDWYHATIVWKPPLI